MDSTSITIQLGNDNVRISSLYKSPKMPLQFTDLEAITNQKLKFIAAGDLNAKHPTWNSRTTNTSGNLLQNHMKSSNSYTICAPVSPTHHSYNPKHAPEVLDIVISNLNDRDFTLTNHNDLSSDHNPIILSISDSITPLNPPKARKRINWKKFEKYLSENLSKINNIKSTEDIDKEISTLTKTIQSALEINSYTVKHSPRKEQLTPDIHLEIYTKRLLRKEWQRTRDPAVKTLLNAQIAYVKQILKDHRQSEWDEFTKTLNFNDRSLYKINRKLLRKTPANTPLIDHNGEKIYDSSSKSELFAKSMEAQFTQNPRPELQDCLRLTLVS
ncbi:hypothetical protein ACI65C_009047 [Semiaphis heraclei]